MAKLTVTGFSFVKGARLPRRLAPVVGKRLSELTETKGESLVAADVVEEARAPSSPLHPLFEWDNTKAAEEYRLVQARGLLRSIQIEFIDAAGSSGETRAYVITTEEDEQRYTPMVEVFTNQGLRAQVLANALRELVAFQAKYDGLRELLGVLRAIKKVVGKRRKRAAKA